MESAEAKGVDTSEWNLTKWILFACSITGILGTGLGAMVTGLVGNGTLEPSSTVAIVLGIVSAVLVAASGAVAGGTSKAYVAGRAEIKAAALKKE